MEELLKKLLENDLLSDDTKNEITGNFKKILEDARIDIERKVRAELAELYQNDVKKIAEAVDKYVNQHMESEITEFHGELKTLAEQRLKYVNAQVSLKENVQNAIKKRLSIFEKALHKALLKETKELHSDLKTNRSAVLREMNEIKAQAAADREAFKQKGAKVLEHIINVKNEKHWAEIKEDIQKAKESDFGIRIYEAFMGEARRLFFNSHKELRDLTNKINEQEAAHKAEKEQLVNKLNEVTTVARKAIGDNKKIQESAVRYTKMNRMLSTIPSGRAREQMKTLLHLRNMPIPF
jgi:hypothetical protein